MKNLLFTIALFAGIASYAADTNTLEANNATGKTETTTAVTTANAAATEAVGDEPSSFGDEEKQTHWQSGFSSITEIGASFMYDKRFVNIYQALGKRVNPYLFIGGGLGVQVKNSSTYQFQLLADIRVNPLNKRVTPIFFTQFGLNKVGPETLYNKEQKYLGSTQFNLNLGTGILVKALPNAAFTLNGGYSLFTDFNKNINGAFVKVGYVF